MSMDKQNKTSKNIVFNVDNKFDEDIAFKIDITYSRIEDGVIIGNGRYNHCEYRSKWLSLENNYLVLNGFVHTIYNVNWIDINIDVKKEQTQYEYTYYSPGNISEENSINISMGEKYPIVLLNNQYADRRNVYCYKKIDNIKSKNRCIIL